MGDWHQRLVYELIRVRRRLTYTYQNKSPFTFTFLYSICRPFVYTPTWLYARRGVLHRQGEAIYSTGPSAFLCILSVWFWFWLPVFLTDANHHNPFSTCSFFNTANNSYLCLISRLQSSSNSPRGRVGVRVRVRARRELPRLCPRGSVGRG